MKAFIFLFLILFNISVFAQETHSPRYKCIMSNTDEVRYLLIGNYFPPNPGVDAIYEQLREEPPVIPEWSNQVILASKEEYYSGQRPPQHIFEFKVKPSIDGFLTHKTEFELEDGSLASTYLLMNESSELIHTIELATDECFSNPTLQVCHQQTRYHCVEQKSID